MEEFRSSLNLDLSLIFSYKLKIDEYFILYCLYTDNQDLLKRYSENCGKLNTEHFISLENKGFININCDKDKIYLSKITLNMDNITPVFSNIINIDIGFDKCFKELIEVFPKAVDDLGGAKRRLQGNISVCRSRYKKILCGNSSNVDINKHNLIIKCLKLQINEYELGKKMRYFQMLQTYLNQETFSLYEEEASKIEDSKIDNINVNNNFTDDI